MGNQEPPALLSEDGQKVVFEFRRQKSQVVVAIVLDREQQPKAGMRLFALAALEE